MKPVGEVRYRAPYIMETQDGKGLRVGGRWLVTCRPHVMIRLKRVFEGVRKEELNVAALSDTPRNAYDLRWFLSAYPMTLDAATQTVLDAKCKQHEDRVAMVEQALSADFVPQAFPMAKPPRDYQAREAELCLRSPGAGILVLDEVGLGKTITAATLFSDPRTRPALYVTQTHLPPQMKEKFEEFVPGLAVHIIKKGTPYDLTDGPRGVKVRFPDIIIISYSKLYGWYETLAPLVKSVVFDEVQELRNGRATDKGMAAAQLSEAVTYRMGLTATPIHNYGGEMYPVVDVLAPGALGEEGEFHREWCTKFGDHYKIKEPKAFGEWLRAEGIAIRHTRREVGRELPKCEPIPYMVESNLDALKSVEAQAQELARTILASGGVTNFDRMQAAGELDMRLRQATGIAKAPYVAAFVRMLVEGGEKVLLFGWHHAVYDIWMSKLYDLNPVLYTGEQTPAQKEKAKRAFVEGDSKVMIMSLRSGSGVDGIQDVCNHVVFGELDWSPTVHIQCIGRLNRDRSDGKPNEAVAAFFLLSDHGSDPVIADVLQIKKMQLEGVTDPDADLVEKLEIDPDRMKKLAEACLSAAEVKRLQGIVPKFTVIPGDAKPEPEEVPPVELEHGPFYKPPEEQDS